MNEDDVAPLAGARIETGLWSLKIYNKYVAPLAGARIETSILSVIPSSLPSLPSRERELKLPDC